MGRERERERMNLTTVIKLVLVSFIRTPIYHVSDHPVC